MMRKWTHAGRTDRVVSIEQSYCLFGSGDDRTCGDHSLSHFGNRAFRVRQFRTQFKADRLLVVRRDFPTEMVLNRGQKTKALLFILFHLAREREVAFDQSSLRGSSVPNLPELDASLAKMFDLFF